MFTGMDRCSATRSTCSFHSGKCSSEVTRCGATMPRRIVVSPLPHSRIGPRTCKASRQTALRYEVSALHPSFPHPVLSQRNVRGLRKPFLKASTPAEKIAGCNVRLIRQGIQLSLRQVEDDL